MDILNRQKSIILLASNMQWKVNDLDKLIAKNLRRIRNERGLTQEELGELAGGVEGTYLSQVENNLTGLGKDVMLRICNALNIQPYKFYIDKDTPLIQNKNEQEIIHIFREAKDLGTNVAEKIPEYGKFIIKETKKSKTPAPRKGRSLRHKKG